MGVPGVIPSDPVTTRSRSDDPSGLNPDALGHCVPAALVEVLSALADRLRQLPESRLKKAAGSAGDLIQLLADVAAGIEARGADEPPQLRAVPTLSVFALGDQIAVTARELTDATRGLSPAETVWWHGARRSLSDALRAVHEAAAGLRAQL